MSRSSRSSISHSSPELTIYELKIRGITIYNTDLLSILYVFRGYICNARVLSDNYVIIDNINNIKNLANIFINTISNTDNPSYFGNIVKYTIKNTINDISRNLPLELLYNILLIFNFTQLE